MQFISIDQIISVTIAAEIIRNHEIQAWLVKKKNPAKFWSNRN